MTDNHNGTTAIEPTEPTQLDQPTVEGARHQVVRRLHLLSAAIIIVVAALIPILAEQYRPQVASMGAIAAALALFTVAWDRLAASRGDYRQLANQLAQVAAGIATVALTGGAQSPFVFLCFPALLLAGLTIGPGAAAITSAAATLGYLLTAFMGAQSLSFSSAAGWANVVSIVVVGVTAAILGWELTRSQQSMAEAKDRAERFSSVDWLTGLYNRRHLDTLIPQEIARARRHGRPVSLMIADADHLKDVNDTLGHLLGDQLLIHIAEVLLDQVRLVDTVVRYGGDEFIVIMPDTDTEGAMIPAERIRAAMDGYEVTANGVTVRTSISAGLAAFPTDAEDAIGLLARADAALYVSKRSGRNRVTIYHPDLPTDRTPVARELEMVE